MSCIALFSGTFRVFSFTEPPRGPPAHASGDRISMKKDFQAEREKSFVFCFLFGCGFSILWKMTEFHPDLLSVF